MARKLLYIKDIEANVPGESNPIYLKNGSVKGEGNPMLRYVLKRILMFIPIILGVTIFVFTLLYFTPGDPAQVILGSDATEEELEACREELGLNDSYLERFARYCSDVFLHGNLGESYINGRSISEEVASRMPKTFTVALVSVILAVCIGMPLGIISATNQYTWKDNTAIVLALLGVSMPGFWVGLMLSLVFALKLGLLPPSGWGGIEYLILPCVSIALSGAGSIARQTRSSMLEVIRQDYITTARAKGQTERKVIYIHALRNALIPIVTQVGTMLGIQLSGAIVAESIFSIPGIGTYMVSGIKNRDYPVVQGSVLVVAIIFSIVMLLVDVAYAFVDPRIKAQYAAPKKRTAKEA